MGGEGKHEDRRRYSPVRTMQFLFCELKYFSAGFLVSHQLSIRSCRKLGTPRLLLSKGLFPIYTLLGLMSVSKHTLCDAPKSLTVQLSYKQHKHLSVGLVLFTSDILPLLSVLQGRRFSVITFMAARLHGSS